MSLQQIVGSNIFIVMMASSLLGFSYEETSTLSVAVTGYTSFILLYKTCQPLNPLRTILFITMFIAFVFGFSLKNLFSFAHFNWVMISVIVVCIIMSHQLYSLVEETENNVLDYLERKRKKKTVG